MRKPDVAYVNGKVYTVDPNFSVATAFCLSDDRFVAVGTDEEIRALCTPETRVVDLHGQVVLPGLIDSHLHINNTGAMKLELNVVAKQRREIVDMVAQAYQTIRPGEWIVGRGWLNDEWPDSSFPTKEELDAVAPDVPVYLKRACGHAAWVNSKAFEAVGVTDATPDPVGGEYLRKPDGTLLGVVTDQAQDPFNKAIPPYNKEQLQKIVLLAQESFFAAGLVPPRSGSRLGKSSTSAGNSSCASMPACGSSAGPATRSSSTAPWSISKRACASGCTATGSPPGPTRFRATALWVPAAPGCWTTTTTGPATRATASGPTSSSTTCSIRPAGPAFRFGITPLATRPTASA